MQAFTGVTSHCRAVDFPHPTTVHLLNHFGLKAEKQTPQQCDLVISRASSPFQQKADQSSKRKPDTQMRPSKVQDIKWEEFLLVGLFI